MEDTDFRALSKDLSHFIGNMSLVRWACGTMRRELAFMLEVREKYVALAAANGVGEEETESVVRALDEGLAELGCANESVEAQAGCLGERAEALIQTVRWLAFSSSARCLLC